MSGERQFAAVVTAGLAARLAHLAIIRDHAFYSLHEAWADSDMHQFVAWARHLAGGDWLDLATFRPYFPWQQAIAPPEVWDSWFGAHVYYQPPLYPYLVAAVLAVTGSLDLFRLLQVALGAVNCGLIALVARRLHGPVAGWVAGIGAAIYAPFILYDAEILRGTVVMTTQALLLIALASCAGSAKARWPLAAGAAFGAGYLAEPSVLLFGPPAAAWLAWIGWRARAAVRILALFAAGAAVALVPLVARNAAAGAPLLSCTTRGPLAFVMGNAPDANPAGAFIPPSTGAILSRSGYRMGPTVSATLAMYDGRYGALLGKQWLKLKALWGAYEVPDNPSLYYAERISPPLRFGLRFLPVAAMGLVGLGIALAGAGRDPAGLIVPLHLMSGVGLFLMAHVVSRYRQPLAMDLLVLAGLAAAKGVEGLRHGRALHALAIAGAAAAIAMLLPWSPPPGYGYVRPAEYFVAADIFAGRGDPDRAIGEIAALIAEVPVAPALGHALPALYYKRGTIQAAAGRHADAVRSFRQALAQDPQYGEAALALEASLAALESGGGGGGL